MKSTLFLVLATLLMAQCQAPGDLFSSTVYRETEGHRMIEMINQNVEGKMEMIDCYMIGDGSIFQEPISSRMSISINEVGKQEMSDLLNECSSFLLNKQNEGRFHVVESRLFEGMLNALVIFPGTKWCGAGNISENENDLGVSNRTDACCRAHDHCNDSIPAGETKYGLKNDGSYTISNCDCDEEFHSCLKGSNEFASKSIGKLYFNVLQTLCFKLEYPIIRCLKYSFVRTCQEYELDDNATKKYQFFDAKYF